MKTAIVTGGGDGLGADIARALSNKDYRVGVLDVREELADETTAKLRNAISCLLYTSPSPRDVEESRMPSSA